MLQPNRAAIFPATLVHFVIGAHQMKETCFLNAGVYCGTISQGWVMNHGVMARVLCV